MSNEQCGLWPYRHRIPILRTPQEASEASLRLSTLLSCALSTPDRDLARVEASLGGLPSTVRSFLQGVNEVSGMRGCLDCSWKKGGATRDRQAKESARAAARSDGDNSDWYHRAKEVEVAASGSFV